MLTDKYFNKGNSFFKLRKYQEAIKNYDVAIKCNPDSAEAYMNKGASLNELGRQQEAMESCNMAIKYDSDNVCAYQLANELAKKLKKSNLRIIN
ncbi:tetratricopeptide repeat protein [Orientia tsutsugamushi]|uniref:TPR repeat-containing protein 04 n=2 Tax=Orientia tsutsugamushi TaxID=784 RepID=B3CQ94_ORITI|nr:tetratricopeptide repeat protein [Orientia tsutsugamushi]KJV51700.1 TPR repeat family protein [Orientia tsutsugamushi str. Kato PP]BAG39790.1 TPR repeat-containing protein 04 [Orientia tsutsugamushi str. Ikeda]SPR07824.1 TPR repeat-containing protein 08 [Orientia tsutsugamushi]